MKIPSKEQFKKQEIIDNYNHFSLRLFDRYGIEITIEEYKSLCGCRCINNYYRFIKNTNKKTCTIIIKGVDVIVVKKKNDRGILVTALPKYEK